MLSEKSVFRYRNQYPEEGCSFAEPSVHVCIRNRSTNEGRISPLEETDEIFLDRLERSKTVGRNLFYEEWPEITENPKDWIL